MSQRISKFESRIDNLLGVITDFENKFINNSETQRIKEQFYNIINKKIYKNRITKDNMHKSLNKTEYNNNDDINNFNVLKDSCIMDIKNINININNNNYENNYFITQSTLNKRSHHKIFNKKPNGSEKKFNIKINNSSLKKTNFKSSKKKSKCISSDLKNKTIQNYKEKSKLFKLPLDSIINTNANKFNIKNYRYNNSFKDLQTPLTDRKEKINEDKIIESHILKNKLKSANKNKNNCLKINKVISVKEENYKKPFIKKDGGQKVNLLKTKKNIFEKNFNQNSIINNTINGGKNNKEKEKFINNNELNKNKDNSNYYINYILNKRNIIKRNNVITLGNEQNEVIKKKNFNNKKK